MQLSLPMSNPLCFIVHPRLTKHFFLLIFSHLLWLTSPSTLEQNFLAFSSPFLSWLSALGSFLSSSEWHPVSRLHEYLAKNSSHWFHGVLILLDYSWGSKTSGYWTSVLLKADSAMKSYQVAQGFIQMHLDSARINTIQPLLATFFHTWLLSQEKVFHYMLWEPFQLCTVCSDFLNSAYLFLPTPFCAQ